MKNPSARPVLGPASRCAGRHERKADSQPIEAPRSAARRSPSAFALRVVRDLCACKTEVAIEQRSERPRGAIDTAAQRTATSAPHDETECFNERSTTSRGEARTTSRSTTLHRKARLRVTQHDAAPASTSRALQRARCSARVNATLS
ncbi:MAG TPA: hypothetical protein VM847_11370, partial [Tahibacter sp.]|nr:hypothetical protein [Tahibacter sp.]